MGLVCFDFLNALIAIPHMGDKIAENFGKDSFLNTKLIESSKFSLTIWDFVEVAIIVVATMIGLKLIKKAIIKNKHINVGKQYSLYSLIKYVVVAISVIWIMQSLGFNLTLILGGSAALLVGIGMGLQNLFSDFVSGIILLIDSSIKVSDVVEVNGLVCEVKKINLRTTLILTRDDKYILLPNSQLTRNNIINWTHNLEASRFDVTVGVGYDSDPELVRHLLMEIVNKQAGVLKTPPPFVRLNDFSDSFLSFTLYFWSTNVFRVENIKSDLRFAIFKRFGEFNIDISLPQRVLHFYNEERGEDFKRYTLKDVK